MNNIVITEGDFLYNERSFKFSEYDELLRIIPRKVSLIIADEKILIKTYEGYENIKNIKTLIDEDFFSGNGILIDHIYNLKNKRLIVYGIRNSNINIFYKNNINSIKPIQKIVADYLVKTNKVEKIKFIFEFNGKTYLNLIKDGNLVESKLVDKLDNEKDEDIRKVNIKISSKKIEMS